MSLSIFNRRRASGSISSCIIYSNFGLPTGLRTNGPRLMPNRLALFSTADGEVFSFMAI